MPAVIVGIKILILSFPYPDAGRRDMSALTVVGSRKEAAERDFTVANLSCPVEVMRFNLVYRGPLPASANKSKPKEASDIREALHPQT
jgi:hypothetical protein